MVPPNSSSVHFIFLRPFPLHRRPHNRTAPSPSTKPPEETLGEEESPPPARRRKEKEKEKEEKSFINGGGGGEAAAGDRGSLRGPRGDGEGEGSLVGYGGSPLRPRLRPRLRPLRVPRHCLQVRRDGLRLQGMMILLLSLLPSPFPDLKGFNSKYIDSIPFFLHTQIKLGFLIRFRFLRY